MTVFQDWKLRKDFTFISSGFMTVYLDNTYVLLYKRIRNARSRDDSGRGVLTGGRMWGKPGQNVEYKFGDGIWGPISRGGRRF